MTGSVALPLCDNMASTWMWNVWTISFFQCLVTYVELSGSDFTNCLLSCTPLSTIQWLKHFENLFGFFFFFFFLGLWYFLFLSLNELQAGSMAGECKITKVQHALLLYCIPCETGASWTPCTQRVSAHLSLSAVLEKLETFWDRQIRQILVSKRKWVSNTYSKLYALLSLLYSCLAFTAKRGDDERLWGRISFFSLINGISPFSAMFSAPRSCPLAVSLTWDSVSGRLFWAL